jgi:hypothetical protein
MCAEDAVDSTLKRWKVTASLTTNVSNASRALYMSFAYGTQFQKARFWLFGAQVRILMNSAANGALARERGKVITPLPSWAVAPLLRDWKSSFIQKNIFVYSMGLCYPGQHLSM